MSPTANSDYVQAVSSRTAFEVSNRLPSPPSTSSPWVDILSTHTLPSPSPTPEAPISFLLLQITQLLPIQADLRQVQVHDQPPTTRRRRLEDFSTAVDSPDKPPIVVELVSPQVRMVCVSERPLSSVSDNKFSYCQSSHSTSHLSDIPPVSLAGFSTPSTPPPRIYPCPSSSTAAMTVAKHVKGLLDKAIRYLLDSDPTPKKCTDPIWLLCVQHPGDEFAPAEATSPTHSHAGVPSTQGMHPLPLPRHLQQCSCSCRQQRALVIPNDIQNTPTHIAHQNPMEISCHASESHVAPTSTPSETRHVPSSSANRPMPLQPESQCQAPLILR
jgi:hypothetical protein